MSLIKRLPFAWQSCGIQYRMSGTGCLTYMATHGADQIESNSIYFMNSVIGVN